MTIVNARALKSSPAAANAIATATIVLLAFLSLTTLAATARNPQDDSTKCRSQLKAIGLAIGVYEADYNNEMPPSLQVLVDLGYQPSSGGNHLVFRCPSAGSGPRAESRGPSSPRATEPGDLKNLESTGDYYYARIKDILNVGTVTSQTGGKKAVNVGAVPIVWEKSAFHAADKVNVLFLDLHVDQIDIPKLEELVKANSASYASPPKLPTAAPTPTPAVAPSPGQ